MWLVLLAVPVMVLVAFWLLAEIAPESCPHCETPYPNFRTRACSLCRAPRVEPDRFTDDGWDWALKRLADVAISAALLVLLAPLLALVALLVRFGSGPGSVLFAHQRLGRGGEPFDCYKFRSMRNVPLPPELARRHAANDFKLPPSEDPRITRVGRFIRATSLDELPQLWNVLRGDMSLVGPRPIVPAELPQYGHDGPIILSTRPGLTGLWQTLGRHRIKYPERAFIEAQYVRDWSFSLDVVILLRTPFALWRGH